MALLEQHIIDFFAEQPFKTIWVGLSGGVDSIVLLCALKKALPQTKIGAVHINHQLQPLAKDWQQFCYNFCQQLAIEYVSFAVDVKQTEGESLEAAARDARYQAFKELIKENECICTAHHEDDQSETFLLQLMRGAGVTGLQALLPRQTFGKGFLVRPLLAVQRNEILQYAELHHLNWVNDPMNQDCQFNRVFLRQEILPLLSKRWPAAKEKIAQSARLLQEAHELLTELAKEDYVSALSGSELDCEKLNSLSLARVKLVLRYWIKQAGFLLPSEKILQNIIEEVIHAQQDACPLVAWQGVEVRRFKNRLYIMKPLQDVQHDLLIEWHNFPESIVMPNDLGAINASDVRFFSKEKKINADQKIYLCFRKGGEKVKVGQQHKSLKKVLQEMNIEPWKRERVVLVYQGEELIAIVIK